MLQAIEKFSYADFLGELDEPLKSAVIKLDQKGVPLQQVGDELAAQPINAMSTKGSNNWDRTIFQKFLGELAAIICGNNQDEFSKKLSGEGSLTVAIIIAAAADFIGKKLGFAAALCTPFVILSFATILKAGLNTFCSQYKPQ